MSESPVLPSGGSSRGGALLPTASRLRGLASEAAWIVLGQVVAALGSVAAVSILTRRLSPAEYGTVALVTTVTSAAQQVFFAPIGFAGARQFSYCRETKRLPALNVAILTNLRRSGLLYLAAYVVAALGTLIFTDTSKTLVLWTFALTVFFGAGSTLDTVQNAARQRKTVAIHKALLQWLRPGLAVVCIAVGGANGLSCVVGFCLASLIVGASQLHRFREVLANDSRALPCVWGGQPTPLVQTLWSFAWPIGLWGMFSWFRMASDRWSLLAFTSSTNVGVYAALYQLSYAPLLLMSSTVNSFVGPILYARAGGGEAAARLRVLRLVGRIFATCFTGVLLVSGGLALGGQGIARILLPASYHASANYWVALVAAGGILASGEILTQGLETNGTKRLIPLKITTNLGGLFMNVIAARYLGVGGVVWAMFAHSILYSAWLAIQWVRDYLEAKQDLERVPINIYEAS